MLNSIINYSIKNKFIVLVGVIAMVAWGIFSLTRLPIDAVPDITDNQVQIITNAPNLAAQEVEQYITFPLELQLANVPEVEQIRSISRFGLSVITVVFNESMEIYLARQLIQEQMTGVEQEISRYGSSYLGPISTGLGQIYQYTLQAAEGYENKYGPTELRTIQDWIVRRQLAGIPGVIEINSSGGYLKQYEVAVNSDRLNGMNLTISDVFDALAANNENTGGSYIEKEDYTYFIRGEGLLKNSEEIEKVVVANRGGIPVLIRDVADVQIGHAPRFGAVTMNGQGEVVAGQVMMLKGANSNQVTKAVKERIEQIIPTLPEGVVLEPYLDRSDLIGRTINTVQNNLIEGGLIVVLILVLLLGNLRAGLIVASIIPLSMLFAFSMMSVFGISANLMSLGAIDFGLIVDGAVIIVESVVFRLGTHFKGKVLNQQEMDEQVNFATRRILKSASFGVLIILIVYIPILSLTGIEGRMFIPMAATVSFALLGALLLSMTYVPTITSLVLKKRVETRETFADRLMRFFRRLYYPILKGSIRARYVILPVALGFFIFSSFMFTRLGGEFIPTLEEGDFALHQMLPPGSSLKQSIKVSGELQVMLLEEFPEVEKVVTKIGTAEIPTDIMPLEAGDIYVIMKPKEEWTSANTRDEMFQEMEKVLSRYPGVHYEFTQPIQMLFNELMTGVRQDIAIKIYGEDMGTLFLKAQQAEGMINSITGVGDVKVEQVEGLQQIVIRYNRTALAQYGLDLAEVSGIIQAGFAGTAAGFIYEGERRFDLVVRLQGTERSNIEDLQKLLVPLPGGMQIPLRNLADIRLEEGPTQIARDNTKRRITIGVNARNRDVESLVNEISEQLNSELNLPPGYYIEYGGQFENLIKARERLLIAVPVALGLIFVLLIITFNSLKQTLMIFTAVPLASIGGVLALWVRDMPFSISAGVGFIALFGVAVLNDIVLIASFNELKKEGMKNIYRRTIQGTLTRLRPVIMTALVASLGFLPMALSTTAGAEVQRPLATVVIGGVLFDMILTLIILPILYTIVESKFSTEK